MCPIERLLFKRNVISYHFCCISHQYGFLCCFESLFIFVGATSLKYDRTLALVQSQPDLSCFGCCGDTSVVLTSQHLLVTHYIFFLILNKFIHNSSSSIFRHPNRPIATMSVSENPIYSPFFGVMGAASAMIFSAMGAAYGTAKSGTGIAAMAVMRPGQWILY